MRKIFLAAFCAALATPSALAEPTLYRSASASASHYGYSDVALDASRARVSFSGNAETYRASEITLARGGRYFRVLDHGVESRTDLAPSGPPMPPLLPRRYHELVRYQASAVIEILRSDPPSNAAAVFDAREVQSNLVWRIAHHF
ncbi:MAG: hypothetical protein AB7O04_08335 [Hyphomonadaceae bacterium]